MPKFTGLLIVALLSALCVTLYHLTHEKGAIVLLAAVLCVGFGFFGSKLWKGGE